MPIGPNARPTRSKSRCGAERGFSMLVIRARIFGLAMVFAVLALPAFAHPVGERHLSVMVASAPLRYAAHNAAVRVTVWYPAAAGAKESRIDLGPPGKPFFI